MNREVIYDYVKKKYNTAPEYLWIKYPSYAVLRHGDNNKWYAVIMNLSNEKINLSGTGKTDVINLKYDVEVSGALITMKGIFPAYHMDKRNWISVLLDGSVNDKIIFSLLDTSYNLTMSKKKTKAITKD